MKFLFIHQNFPGQFKFLAPTLASSDKNQVATLTMQKSITDPWNKVRVARYGLNRGSSKSTHPWVVDLETKTIRAEACFHGARKLRELGFTPDVIIAHPGWGESLFLKEVWPNARLGIYCEFFYHPTGLDVDFDPEFPVTDPGDPCRLKLKNVNNLLHFEIADAGISPTGWQADTFPQPFRDKISVIHDGIDTDLVVPRPDITMTLNKKVTLSRKDEIITFVNRNLEPTRGYHVFMRALPKLLKERPNARVLIVGGNDTSYGPPPASGTWKQIYLDEVADRIDRSRVHFLGHVPYPDFLGILQLSTVHVYLTYPFVLSWSLLEAMSAGCAIVASNTGPLWEAIKEGETGRLVDFFDVDGLADRVIELLDDPAQRARLGANAREFARANYDVKRICLPRQLQWVTDLAGLPNKM